MNEHSDRIHPGPLADGFHEALARLDENDVVERVWGRDGSLWPGDPAAIIERLGWLEVPWTMRAQIDDLRAFAQRVREEGVTDVVLLGMGGSSLGAELLWHVLGGEEGWPRLRVLDSTVPAWIESTRQAIDAERTLFLVCSKSGGTLEVLTLYAYFRQQAEAAVGERAGRHFVAITDPGSPLATIAGEADFRRTFLNPADIGGRFSVLSLFGLVPAALIGLDLDRLLDRAGTMAERCSPRPGRTAAQDPAARLGALLSAAALAGRNKATLLTTPQLDSFGLWAEQLVAESTGKQGKGVLPIATEPWGEPRHYGKDRLFIALRCETDDNGALDRQIDGLVAAGFPLAVLPLADSYDLGAELFRWQMATALCGHLLALDPFDQPDVESTKRNASAILADFEATGSLPAAVPAGADLAAEVEQHRPDYVALMAYLGCDPAVERGIRRLRRRLLHEAKLTTSFGYAPRLLHSTGQFHKGGPAGGLYVQLLPADSTQELPIPGRAYGFATLARAQADADARALIDKGRRLIRIEVSRDPEQTLPALL